MIAHCVSIVMMVVKSPSRTESQESLRFVCIYQEKKGGGTSCANSPTEQSKAHAGTTISLTMLHHIHLIWHSVTEILFQNSTVAFVYKSLRLLFVV